jgi:hypothetical protein
MFASFGMSYEEFVRFYLNKRNPANGMWWQLSDMSEATGTDLALLTAYCRRAQDKNYRIVAATGKSATVDQLLED